MENLKLKIDMHCASCAQGIDKALIKKGLKPNINPTLKLVKVSFDESKISSKEIIQTIKEAGYDSEEV